MINDEKNMWLCDEMKGLKEKINFRDRIEYRVNGLIHNSYGPAIINKFDPLHQNPLDEDNIEEYYIGGEKITYDEWLLYNRKHKIQKIIKKTKKEV